MSLVRHLTSGNRLIAAELRPPRAELAASASMDAWIDTYHAVRRLTHRGMFVFLTDSAVGAEEEDNLRHLVSNLGPDAPHERVVPFLTCKHSLDYCLNYADRARQHRFSSLVVLGGDRDIGVRRCVEHAYELRQRIRQRDKELELGGWANPYADAARQVGYLTGAEATADFYLTQIVSHHATGPVERFIDEANRRGLTLPGIFGVFFYRSANPRTLAALSRFLPVPAEALAREFASGAGPEEVCARTLRAMARIGVRHFYISNLPLVGTDTILTSILERAALD